MSEIKLILLDPGHFHAALVQKDMYPAISRRVSVYAPLTGDLLDYLNRIAAFNLRHDQPTSWELDVHTGPDYFDRMLKEHPGNVVIITGRNRPKMDRIKSSVHAGINVLADKPWIIRSADLQKLSDVLNTAEANQLVGYDIMTERYEITSILQRELVNDKALFGELVKGTDTEPAITARSVHHLMKVVAGIPLRRPTWFFDIDEYGEGLADVGTHVVDLVQWTAFPDQALDYKADVRITGAKRWPIEISKVQFQQVTGVGDFPRELTSHVKDGTLQYYCNNSVNYTLRGTHVGLSILWAWEAPEGQGDVYEASFRGSKARIELRQDKNENYKPELYVVPNSPDLQSEVIAALKNKVDDLQKSYRGLGFEQRGSEARLTIPDTYRVGHEDHFAQVTRQFFNYLKSPQSMPGWEKSNMLVKYYITTKGVEAATP